MQEIGNHVSELNKMYNELGTKKLRILTFQSEEVLDIIRTEHIYHADSSKIREGRDNYYHKDIEQLNGYQPIWGFSPIDMKSVRSNKFEAFDFLNGCKFQRFVEEMSISKREINKKLLMEVEIEANKIKVGITHNSCSFAVVFPEIKLENLVGVYQLHYVPGDELKFFYCDVNVLETFKCDSLFKNGFTCRHVSKKELDKHYNQDNGNVKINKETENLNAF